MPLDPGKMNPPTYAVIESRNVLLSWSPPDDPNGIIIDYSIEVEPLRFDETNQSQVGRDVMACYMFLKLPLFLQFTVNSRIANVSFSKKDKI